MNNNELLIISPTSWSRPKYEHSYSADETHPLYKIRHSIFCITAVCVGLPCLIWAFYSVHLQRKAIGRISAFIILLLLNHLLQLLLYSCLVSYLLSSGFNYHPGIILLLIVCLKIAGLHLQPLVALEAALTMKYPMISARLCSRRCYIIITVFIPVMYALGFIFGGPVVELVCLGLTFGSFLLPACLLVATGIIIYMPTTTSTSVTDSRPGLMIFTVSLVTLLVLYLPSVILSSVLILNFHLSESWLIMTFCLLSLTVISEPLLCVLVCRQNLSAQTKQTRIEHDSEQTSV